MLTVDGQKVRVEAGDNLLAACLRASIYIPHLCYHPAIPSCEEGKGCGLCQVIIDDNPLPVNACQVVADTVNSVTTDSDLIRDVRQRALSMILATHPHACLTCDQAEGCTRIECSQNVSRPERCCDLFGNCEVQKVAAWIGIPAYTPRYKPTDLPVITDQPFYNIDYNLCIACGRCLRVCRDVKKVDVFEISEKFGRPIAVPRENSMKDSGCIFCGACVEVCPTGTLMDKPWEFDGREHSIVPCRATCPAEIDVPLYVRLVAEKRYGEAVAVIREKAPIPGILGRVCYNPCETGCRRKVWGEPVAIRSLKRFAADHDNGFWSSQLETMPSTGKKVAVVGAGPAGLTASYYLRILGHDVDLYDSMSKPGGMLRYGIPCYRLAEETLDSEIQATLDLGVRFHAQTRIESPSHLSDCDAVFWATGASLSVALPKGIAKEDDIVTDGLDFLRRINSGEAVKTGDEVVVIGGGNVATDVARCAVRLGAKKTTIVYRRTRDEMPAYESEIEEALAEGIEIRFLLTPARIEPCGSKIKVTLQRLRLGKPGADGRRAPVPIEGELAEIKADSVIAAIGQRVETTAELKVGANGAFEVAESSLVEDRKGIFIGGDNVTGPSSVVAAVEAGRLAAVDIDRYLGGSGVLPTYKIEASTDLTAGDEVKSGLEKAPCLRVESRTGFDEIEAGYSEISAVAQASRCARCDLRLRIPAVTFPPERYLRFCLDQIEVIPAEPGVVTLYSEEENILLVAGSENMRENVRLRIEEGFEAASVSFEEHQMYTQRESELLAQHLQKYGSLPTGNDLDDELF